MRLFVYRVTLFLETAEKLSLPSTNLEQSAGSQELAQEAVNLMKLNQSVRCFLIKNYCVVALGQQCLRQVKRWRQFKLEQKDT